MVTEAPAPKKSSEGLIGQLLANRYQIEYKLGEGAMGAVFRARHVKFGRPFAVKVLHPKLLDDKKLALRFEREAELAGRLRHPNVIGVVDVGETPDGLRYMVMDFVQGADLAEILQEAPMPPDRIIPLVRQMLEGLYHAHEAGLIHRDFKPENVIVERDDHGKEVPRIVDFGIAILREGGSSTDSSGRLTTNGLVLGTPHYMAPEQAVADPIDHRIDLFAMGIVVYEMLSGMLPFDGSGAEVARANLLLDPPPISHRAPGLEVDPLLEAFARRLMAKRRDQRPATAKAARELLDMIERDRAAAAAALGVPLDVGTRPPQTTQPMEPMAAAALLGPPGTPAPVATPPLAATATPRPSELEAPPLPQPQAVATGSPRPATAPGTNTAAAAPAKQGATTTAMSEPLPWSDGEGGERPSKRRWLIAGGVGVAAAGALVAAVLGVFGGGSAAPAPAAPQVATPTPPAPTPAPAVAAAATEQPARAPATPTVEPIAVEPTAPSSTDPAPSATKRDPATSQASKGDPRRKTPSSVKTDTGAAKTTKITSTPAATDRPAETATPAPAKAGPTNEQLWADYQQVNTAINALEKAQGTAAVQDLRQTYRHVGYYEAIAPGADAKRQQLIANLAKLRADLAKWKKP